MRPSWVRAVRAVTLGLITPATVAVAERERELITRIRAPVGHPRRVAVLGAKGGVGTTTVTALLGGVLAGMRRDRSVVLDLSGPRGDLHTRVGVHNPPDLSNPAVFRAESVPVGVGNLLVHVLRGAPANRALPPPEVLRRLLTRLESDYAFALLDLGDQPETPHAAMGLDVADTVVLVTSRTPDSIAAARAILDLVACGAGRTATGGWLLVQTSLAPARRALLPAPTPPGSLPLRFARALADGGPIHPSRLTPGFREDVLAAAAAVAGYRPSPPAEQALQ